jgi:hypothetical protein
MFWPDEIAKLALIKQRLADADKKCLWPYHLPSLAASRDMLNEAESVLRLDLDLRYATFLLYANGWKGFYQSVDLFGTNDLAGSDDMTAALKLAHAIEENVLITAGVAISQILPIAWTRHDLDLFALTLPGSSNPGEVLWFAGGLIERFANFDEYYLAMVDYNRAELARMLQQNPENRRRLNVVWSVSQFGQSPSHTNGLRSTNLSLPHRQHTPHKGLSRSSLADSHDRFVQGPSLCQMERSPACKATDDSDR